MSQECNILTLTLTPSSIEMAKQKLEKDQLHREAELKVAETQKQLAELRRRFKKVLSENQSLPEHVCLKSEVWTQILGIIHLKTKQNTCFATEAAVMWYKKDIVLKTHWNQ